MISFGFSLGRLFRANLAALTFHTPAPLPFPEDLLLIVLHGLGLLALSRYFHLPWTIVISILPTLMLFAFVVRRTTALAPFFFLYAALATRYAFIRIAHGTVGGYFDYLTPDWGLALFRIEAATLAAACYSALIAAVLLLNSRRHAAWLAASTVLAVTFIWAGVVYIGQRTSGTTGSDPYDYVQMGVDLATRGSALHHFSLFPEIASLKIAWYPVLHVGYHLPLNQQGAAVTVFPSGGAFAYALAYRTLGDPGLYWVNPLFSLLSALAAGLLGWQLTSKHDRVVRSLTAAGTAALVATANQQVVWASVTMADAQAEFFSILSIYFALRALQANSLRFPILAGLSLAAAYWVRHTQIVLAPCLLILLWHGKRDWQARIRAIAACGGSTFLLAFGDLWYHQGYLGGWLHPESEELALFSANGIGETANLLYQQLFAANEFGWVAPFLIYGAVEFAGRARAAFWALATWIGLSLAFHLPYAALRLRDLLPEYPAIAFLTAYGICMLTARLVSGRRTQLAAGLVTFAVLDLLVLRVWNTAARAWQTPTPAFGYVTGAQRAAFNQLGTLTSPDAVVGSTLNDGAIELYARRNTFRPDGWSSGELREFLRVVRTSHPDIYLLEDGSAMDSVWDDLRQDSRLELVATLDVPLFGGAPAKPGALWKLVGPND